MGNKRLKIHRGLSKMIPLSINFSQLQKQLEDGDISYEPSDDGFERKRLEDNLQYEEMVVQILLNLEEREKLIFIFQLLRDNGYQIDHGSFAKITNLSRRQYMRVLDDVRLKSALFIAGYSNKFQSHKESK